MMLVSREVGLLVRKEWRQLRANRQVVLTSMIIPVLFLLVVPQLFVYGALRMPARADHPAPEGLPGFAGDITADPSSVAITLLPLFVGLAGLIVPIVLAIHAVISERESRTLELMIALPVRVEQVLRAKLLSVISFTCAVCGAALLVVAIELLVFGLASVVEVLALYVELVTASCAGTSAALVVGLMARDFRTSQNVAAPVVLPLVIGSILVANLVGGGWGRPLAMAAAYATVALLLTAHASRQTTFEQLLR